MLELDRTPQRLAPLRRAACRVGLTLIVFFMLLEAATAFVNIGTLQATRLNGTASPGVFEDYVAYYSASRLLIEGKAEKMYDIGTIAGAETAALGRPVGESGGVLPFFNPPFVALMTAPLAVGGLNTSSTGLLIVVTLTICAGGIGLQGLVGANELQTKAFLWLAFLSFAPIAWLLAEEQLSMLVFLGWLGFAFYQRQRRPSLSGSCLALALVKPQMVLVPVLVLVWKHQWSTLKSFAFVAGALALVSISLSGPRVVLDYPSLLVQSSHWQNQGVRADHMYGWNSLLAVVTHDSAPSFLPWSLLTTATLAVVFAAGRRAWETDNATSLERSCVLLLASLLVNPHFYQQDLVLVVLCLALLVAASRERGARLGEWTGPAVLTWLIGLYGPRLLYDHSLPVVPIALAAALAGVTLSICRRTHQTASQGVVSTTLSITSPAAEAA